MRMALDSGPLITAAEAQRQLRLHHQRVQKFRAEKRMRLQRMLFQGVHRIFIFLLGATLVASIIARRNEIDALTRKKANQVVAHVQTKTEVADPLRQNALSYEQEVDEASK